MSKFAFEMIFYPGKNRTTLDNEKLVTELRDLAALCLETAPNYQALTGKQEDLDRAVIATARNSKGELVGFCSGIMLDIDGVGKVFHTGLTCVHANARGEKLTHTLISKLLTKYLITESLFKKIWVTNCACVLSSLGNIAVYFEDVYPSPYGPKNPSAIHLNIAKTVNKKYREQMDVNVDANFNVRTFVFEGSVKNSVWEKDPRDIRFHHRKKKLTGYYQKLLDFSRGDEVLQIGSLSVLTVPKYQLRQVIRKIKKKLHLLKNHDETNVNDSKGSKK